MEEFIPEVYRKPVLVLGCGNVLFGDDGFGPAAVEYFQKHYKVPEDVCVMDAGTGVREILFTIVLGESKPDKIIIVDAVDAKRVPGEVFEVKIDDIPLNKIDDFSLHQLPTSNLLKELAELCGVEVKIIAAQIEGIPELVRPGLSMPLEKALPRACAMIEELIQKNA